MKSNYKIITIITILLLTLSITISFFNYMVSKNETQTNLRTQSLPLSVDNIYTVIQKQLIEPYLVSSMMAHDTFLKHWLLHDENETRKIADYLSSIKEKYGLLTSFLVSQESQNYYTHNETVNLVQFSPNLAEILNSIFQISHLFWDIL